MKPLRFTYLPMAAASLFVMFLFIMAAFSDSVSPEKSILFAYLGLLFPVIGIVNICFLTYWLLTRQWKFFCSMLFSLLICWKPLACYCPVHLHAKEIPERKVIKILTYNVMCFNYSPHTKQKPNPILQYIIDSKADIVCLQEYMDAKSEQFPTDRTIAAQLKMYPYHFYLPLSTFPNYSTGLAIYSRYPIRKSWKVHYNSAFNGSTVHELFVNGKTVMLVNNHLESFKLTMKDRSTYTDFIKNINSETFDELRATMQRKLGAAYLIRAEQADIIAEEIRKLNGDYVIVCGDFNDTPISYAHRTIQGPLVDSYVESGNGPGVTYNQNYFRFRIDHILHSPNMKAYQATVDRIAYSDHYPVWCYLEMN